MPDASHEQRGTGRTTRQIKNAPKNAIFICPNEAMVQYVKRITRTEDRTDLDVQSVRVLERGGEMLRGRECHVIFDHAVWEDGLITDDKLDGVEFAHQLNARMNARR